MATVSAARIGLTLALRSMGDSLAGTFAQIDSIELCRPDGASSRERLRHRRRAPV